MSGKSEKAVRRAMVAAAAKVAAEPDLVTFTAEEARAGAETFFDEGPSIPLDPKALGLVGPDGAPASTVEAVHDEPIPATIYDFRAIVAKNWPLLPPREAEAQARAMLARHPLIEKAYRDGLRQGRDCRERWERGMGIEPWESLAALKPNERGFVLARVKAAVTGARA